MPGWEVFDHLHPIVWTSRTDKTVDQTTGLITQSAPTTVNITGNFDENPLEEEGRRPGGLFLEGDALLYTEALLQKGDDVRVYHDATNYTDFRVVGRDGDYDWIDQAQKRPAYILRRHQVS